MREVILDPRSSAEKITIAEAEPIAEEIMIGGAIKSFRKQPDELVPDHPLPYFSLLEAF